MKCSPCAPFLFRLPASLLEISFSPLRASSPSSPSLRSRKQRNLFRQRPRREWAARGGHAPGLRVLAVEFTQILVDARLDLCEQLEQPLLRADEAEDSIGLADFLHEQVANPAPFEAEVRLMDDFEAASAEDGGDFFRQRREAGGGAGEEDAGLAWHGREGRREWSAAIPVATSHHAKRHSSSTFARK